MSVDRVRQALRPYTTVVGASFRVSIAGTFLAASDLLGVAIGALQPLLLAALVPAAVARDQRALLIVSGLLALSMVTQWLMEILGTTARLNQMERLGHHFDQNVLRMISAVPTIDTTSSKDFLDKYHILREQRGVLGSALSMLITSSGQAVTVAITVVLAVSTDWRLLPVVLFALPILFTARWTSKWHAAAEQAGAEDGRRVHELVDLAASPAPSSELRIFRATKYYRELVRSSVEAWQRPGATAARKGAVLEAGCAVLYFLAALGALSWMLVDFRRGSVAPETLVLAVLLVARIQSVGQTAQWSLGGIRRVARTIEHYLWLKDALTGLPPVGRSTAGSGGLEVQHLTYTYPGTEKPALEDVDLAVKPGQVLAILGANGSGKTTLVRCIAGLLRPEAGHVAIGRPADSDRDSGCFQDFARFEIVLREGVGLGEVEHLDDVDAIRRSLADAGLTSVVDRLPNGEDTLLGSAWSGGVGLSTGQWQRVAIARAFRREHPRLLLLDEPSASLDALAERDLLQQLRQRARSTADSGGVAVLVTHRPSTAALADLVVVMAEGRILERGTPAELSHRDGLFAQLYRDAAAGYAPELRDDDAVEARDGS